MVFSKGDPNINRSGRAKGNLNKVTDIRKAIEWALTQRSNELMRMKIADLCRIWASIQPKDQNIRVKPDIQYISNTPEPKEIEITPKQCNTNDTNELDTNGSDDVKV